MCRLPLVAYALLQGRRIGHVKLSLPGKASPALRAGALFAPVILVPLSTGATLFHRKKG